MALNGAGPPMQFVEMHSHPHRRRREGACSESHFAPGESHLVLHRAKHYPIDRGSSNFGKRDAQLQAKTTVMSSWLSLTCQRSNGRAKGRPCTAECHATVRTKSQASSHPSRIRVGLDTPQGSGQIRPTVQTVPSPRPLVPPAWLRVRTSRQLNFSMPPLPLLCICLGISHLSLLFLAQPRLCVVPLLEICLVSSS